MGNILDTPTLQLGSHADTSFPECQTDKIHGCLTCPACLKQQQSAGKRRKDLTPSSQEETTQEQSVKIDKWSAFHDLDLMFHTINSEI